MECSLCRYIPRLAGESQTSGTLLGHANEYQCLFGALAGCDIGWMGVDDG